MRVLSLAWLLGGVTLAVFGELWAALLVQRRRWPLAQLGALRRTFVLAGGALVLVGLVFLAGLSLPGTLVNSLVLILVLARLQALAGR